MINKVILVGNLGRDPELRYTPSGTAVATLNVATNRKRRDQDGNYNTETEWHRVIVWNQTAEFCGNYLQKGNLIYVEGRLQTRKWTDQGGIERYTTEVIADNLQSLTPKGDGGSRSFQEEPPLPEEPSYGGSGQFGGYGNSGDSFATSGGDSSEFSDSFKGESDTSKRDNEFGGDNGTGDDDDMPF